MHLTLNSTNSPLFGRVQLHRLRRKELKGSGAVQKRLYPEKSHKQSADRTPVLPAHLFMAFHQFLSYHVYLGALFFRAKSDFYTLFSILPVRLRHLDRQSHSLTLCVILELFLKS